MITPNAIRSGNFLLGGGVEVNRLGFGAMRVTGPGTWGQPGDREECLATLRLAPELGINLIDTADSYGPLVSEPLVREALHPYPPGLVIATKGGQVRTGPDRWVPLGRPEYLLQQVQMSLRILGLDQITLWQLHRIDRNVPRDEQFGAIKQMLDVGWIRLAGLSEVSVEEIEAARRVFPVATVQNRSSITHRAHDDVLDYCEEHRIGFIPWHPLAAGKLAAAGTPLAEAARRHGATPSQVAIAWLLARSPVMLPIPGTSKRAHLVENVGAAGVTLTPAEVEVLGRASRRGR